MDISLNKIIKGYGNFRKKYLSSQAKTIQHLMYAEQNPDIMIISCCDSRVEPSMIFECDPGDLFTVRNIASIVPPYEKDNLHHGTSAALEFGVKFLNVKNLILIGHSNCGGIRALLNENFEENDFISNWIEVSKDAVLQCKSNSCSLEDCIKLSLNKSYENCMTFPWIKEKVEEGTLFLHRWFFNLQTGTMTAYNPASCKYEDLEIAYAQTGQKHSS